MNIVDSLCLMSTDFRPESYSLTHFHDAFSAVRAVNLGEVSNAASTRALRACGALQVSRSRMMRPMAKILQSFLGDAVQALGDEV